MCFLFVLWVLAQGSLNPGRRTKTAIYYLLLQKLDRAILAVSNCHHGKFDDPHYYC